MQPMELLPLFGGGSIAPNLGKERFVLWRAFAPALGPDDDANRLTVGTTDEGKGVLAIVKVNQVALTVGTSSQRLDRVYRSHIGFDDGNDFLILSVRPDLIQADLRCPDADGQARAHVAMETLDKIYINHELFS
jgi:hypothetical protein